MPLGGKSTPREQWNTLACACLLSTAIVLSLLHHNPVINNGVSTLTQAIKYVTPRYGRQIEYPR